MTTYAVEFSRASYITIVVDAANKDEAVDLAGIELRHIKNPLKHYCWEIESITEMAIGKIQIESIKEIP